MVDKFSIEKQRGKKMKEKEIKNIFGKLGISVKKVSSASNSFNSNVYIVNSDDEKKYVLKISNSEKKRDVESRYMKYLSQYLPTAKILDNGCVDNKNYIVMTFFEGDNKFDEDASSLTASQLRNIGLLLAKLHNTPLIDKNNDSWINYLNDGLEKTQEVLSDMFGKDNEKIYRYLKQYIDNELKDNYKNCILHMDFRIGNLMFKKDEIGLIDMESMKNGDYVFDFVKMHRVLTEDKFNILLLGYKEIRKIDDNFFKKLDFYSLFDSYTSLWWSASKNKTDSDFYRTNYAIVMKYLGVLNEKGNI